MTESAYTQQSEEAILSEARAAVSASNWVVGKCAALWTKKFARGRTDADFGQMVGLSGDQIYQRRRVWEAFGKTSDTYRTLKWSFFYAALNWEDATKCLQWADENEATVAEMRAWRRAQNGEDLFAQSEEAYSEWAAPLMTSAVNLDETDVPTELEPMVAKPGPQRGPASTAQINAQSKQAQVEFNNNTPPEGRSGPSAGASKPERSDRRRNPEPTVSEGESASAETGKAENDSPDKEPNLLDCWKTANQLLDRIQFSLDPPKRKKLAADLRRRADKLDPQTKFKAPCTIEEIRAYAEERGWNGFDAEKFWNHYELANWKYGKTKTPLKRWKTAAAQAWQNGKGWAAQQVDSREQGMDWSQYDDQ